MIADGNTTAPPATAVDFASAGYVFVGPTTIVLTGSTFTVTNANYNGGVAKTGLTASNGVIYIANTAGRTCAPYSPYLNSYSVDYCGDATVSGTYSSSLTIGTDNDIIINGNLIPSTV